eukprot:9389691-Pyramimonas_sp.AAC.1
MAHATRAMRWRKMLTKKKKLATMKFTHRGRNTRLDIINRVPTVLYGGDVHAFSPAQVHGLRAQVSKSMGMSMKGLDAEIAWALTR